MLSSRERAELRAIEEQLKVEDPDWESLFGGSEREWPTPPSGLVWTIHFSGLALVCVLTVLFVVTGLGLLALCSTLTVGIVLMGVCRLARLRARAQSGRRDAWPPAGESTTS